MVIDQMFSAEKVSSIPSRAPVDIAFACGMAPLIWSTLVTSASTQNYRSPDERPSYVTRAECAARKGVVSPRYRWEVCLLPERYRAGQGRSALPDDTRCKAAGHDGLVIVGYDQSSSQDVLACHVGRITDFEYIPPRTTPSPRDEAVAVDEGRSNATRQTEPPPVRKAAPEQSEKAKTDTEEARQTPSLGLAHPAALAAIGAGLMGMIAGATLAPSGAGTALKLGLSGVASAAAGSIVSHGSFPTRPAPAATSNVPDDTSPSHVPIVARPENAAAATALGFGAIGVGAAAIVLGAPLFVSGATLAGVGLAVAGVASVVVGKGILDATSNRLMRPLDALENAVRAMF